MSKVKRFMAHHDGDMSENEAGRWMEYGQFQLAVNEALRESAAYRVAILDAAVALVGEGQNEAAISLLMIVSQVRST